MKKQNYIYLAVIIIALVIWVIDLNNFFKWTDIWYWIKAGYLIVGPCIVIGCLEEMFSKENNNTGRNCDRCKIRITIDEDSEHIVVNGSTLDYCKNCKGKVIK